jgi:hypothetical protein
MVVFFKAAVAKAKSETRRDAVERLLVVDRLVSKAL